MKWPRFYDNYLEYFEADSIFVTSNLDKLSAPSLTLTSADFRSVSLENKKYHRLVEKSVSPLETKITILKVSESFWFNFSV